ncbi:MerR family transcriptional regulator [Glycomyces sp. TRM65418]|uniref:MerR family transcriptional regulator n=1 Tax=Glycomyces sp. TRM65418 TaxID=2867006 RepID=UPI001CE6A36B|nr:MerR family transcriptional regulator [Glycomyces sp. TRM65418]QZD57209.1 MerR family transcriptional regulator [Glycomyces sp. TRM65418]
MDHSDPAGRPAVPHGQVRGWRGTTACRVVGITYRQLDYWARTGLLEPSIRRANGSGSNRLYSFRDIVVLNVIKRLLDAGVSLQNIRKAVDALRSRSVKDLVEITLMSDGTTVYECRSAAEVIDLLRGGQGVFGIAVRTTVTDVMGRLAALPGEAPAPAPAPLHPPEQTHVRHIGPVPGRRPTAS